MDQATAGLIGVAVGGIISAVTAIATSHLTTRNQILVEREKAGLGRHEALVKELRSHVADVTREMLAAQHSMEWVCWHGTQAPHLINNELVTQYHREIHTVIPQLLGSLAVVASFNQGVYEDLSKLADKLYEVEGKIARALAHHKSSPKEALETLEECHPLAMDLYKTLPPALAAVMRTCNNQLQSNVAISQTLDENSLS